MEEVAVPESGIAAPEPSAVTNTHPAGVAKIKGDHQEQQQHEDCDGINGRSAHDAGQQGEVVNDDREDDEPTANPSQETATAAGESRNDKTPPDEAVKDVDNDEPSAEPKQDTTAAESQARSKVSFGDVHIHKHRMTLGANPSTNYGVPVELAWDQASSSELFTVDNYEEQQHRTSLHRLNRHKRQEIAQVNHSRDSILKREVEVHEAQQSIERSNREWDQQQTQERLKGGTSCCAIF